MSSSPDDTVFRINEKIREIVRKRIHELEDFAVSVAIQAYNEVRTSRKEDPFVNVMDGITWEKDETLQGLHLGEDMSLCKDISLNVDITSEEIKDIVPGHTDAISYETEDEECTVTTRLFNGKEYYTFLDDEGQELCGVHERIVTDNESEIGDLAGYVDTQDRFWEAIKVNGKIEEYEHDGIRVPAVSESYMRYPDLESLTKE